jgi:Uma2 family endonuclease
MEEGIMIVLDAVHETALGDEDMGSFNHGYIQLRLGGLLDRLGTLTPVAELSLDVSGIDLNQFELQSKTELIPDISLYPKRTLSRPTDIQRMREMPLVAIEILSPRQGFDEILEKFKVYFALGIKSCWLVAPAINAISVYSAPTQWTTFTQGDVGDETVGIRLPLDEIFA